MGKRSLHKLNKQTSIILLTKWTNKMLGQRSCIKLCTVDLIFLREQLFFIQFWLLKYIYNLDKYLINILNIKKSEVWISSPKVHSAPLMSVKYL